MDSPNSKSPLPTYRQRVLKCLSDNLATDALWGMGEGAVGGALLGALEGGGGGAVFGGLPAIPGAAVGALAGGAIGGAAGGVKAIGQDFRKCLVTPNGVKIP